MNHKIYNPVDLDYSQWIYTIVSWHDVNQANTNHENLLKYDGPMTRAHIKKFKNVLGVFVEQEIILGMENQSASANGSQLSAFGDRLEKGQNHHFYILISYSDL